MEVGDRQTDNTRQYRSTAVSHARFVSETLPIIRVQNTLARRLAVAPRQSRTLNFVWVLPPLFSHLRSTSKSRDRPAIGQSAGRVLAPWTGSGVTGGPGISRRPDECGALLYLCSPHH